METLSIAVLHRAGTHSALYVPPPSRQSKMQAPATVPRFDRAAIMRKAWADYREAARKGWTTPGQFDPERWSYCLRWAWMLAKVEVEKAAKMAALAESIAQYLTAPAAPATNSPLTARTARIAAINSELQSIEYSDAYSAGAIHRAREMSLRAELATLGG
jgi:hypothetical protein